MGKQVKRFVAVTSEGRVTGKAKIDTGADQTILGLRQAKALGIDVCTAPRAAMRSVGDSRIVGLRLPVDIRVGKREATVIAFVPLFRERQNGTLDPVRRDRNLIGHDFLQQSKAALDYSKPHGQVFSGSDWPFEWKLEKMSEADSARVRKKMKCPR